MSVCAICNKDVTFGEDCPNSSYKTVGQCWEILRLEEAAWKKSLVHISRRKNKSAEVKKQEILKAAAKHGKLQQLSGATLLQKVLARDGDACCYCGKQATPPSTEHVEAKANGGKNATATPENYL
jgi:hypothetical protein